MSPRSLLVPLALAAAATAASAQSVHLRGKVEDQAGNPGHFVVGCTNTELTSAVVDLQSLVGQQVALDGSWNGSATDPVVDVASATIVNKLFEVGGNGKLGGQVSFKITSDPGDFGVMFAAIAPGFLNAHRPGVLFLSLSPLLTVASGFVAADGTFEVKGDVPDDPALDGVTVYGQSFISFVAGGSALSNPDCITLSQ
jgi:hypothetical protein